MNLYQTFCDKFFDCSLPFIEFYFNNLYFVFETLKMVKLQKHKKNENSLKILIKTRHRRISQNATCHKSYTRSMVECFCMFCMLHLIHTYTEKKLCRDSMCPPKPLKSTTSMDRSSHSTDVLTFCINTLLRFVFVWKKNISTKRCQCYYKIVILLLNIFFFLFDVDLFYVF